VIRYSAQLSLELELLYPSLDQHGRHVRNRANDLFASFRFLPWQDCYLQTVIRTQQLYIHPPEREPAPRKIVPFQEHIFLKNIDSRKTLFRCVNSIASTYAYKLMVVWFRSSNDMYIRVCRCRRLTKNEGLPLEELTKLLQLHALREPNMHIVRAIIHLVPPLTTPTQVRALMKHCYLPMAGVFKSYIARVHSLLQLISYVIIIFCFNII
jgi:hypothetical protein